MVYTSITSLYHVRLFHERCATTCCRWSTHHTWSRFNRSGLWDVNSGHSNYQIGPDQTKSKIPIIKSRHFSCSYIIQLGLERELMGRVAKLKLQYFGHITRGSAGQLAPTVLEVIMEGLRHQGRPRRQWIHDIEEWTGCEYIQLKEMSQDRAEWRRKI